MVRGSGENNMEHTNYIVDADGNALSYQKAKEYLPDLGPGVRFDPIDGKVTVKYTLDLERVRREQDATPPECFAPGTPVTMADGTIKPIEDVQPGDEVLSYDADGELKSGRVTRTFVNEVRCLLDLHGLMVTPGHATFCAEGRFEGRHVPVIDILRSDGAMMRADGTKVRAATGAEVGSLDDRRVQCVLTRPAKDGSGLIAIGTHHMRYGTRTILEDGRDVSIRELVEAQGGTLTDQGLIEMPGIAPGPFNWSAVQPMFPKPEDYVLARSGLTLDEIYEADEWETAQPEMPAPATLDLSAAGDGSGIGANLDMALAAKAVKSVH